MHISQNIAPFKECCILCLKALIKFLAVLSATEVVAFSSCRLCTYWREYCIIQRHTAPFPRSSAFSLEGTLWDKQCALYMENCYLDMHFLRRPSVQVLQDALVITSMLFFQCILHLFTLVRTCIFQLKTCLTKERYHPFNKHLIFRMQRLLETKFRSVKELMSLRKPSAASFV